MSYATQLERNIKGDKFYWKFHSVAHKLLKEQNYCSICGSTNGLEVHHIVQSKFYDHNYSNESNIIVLCGDCHKKYHQNFKTVNAKTFIEFTKRRYQSTLQLKLNKALDELEEAKNELNILKNQMEE